MILVDEYGRVPMRAWQRRLLSNFFRNSSKVRVSFSLKCEGVTAPQLSRLISLASPLLRVRRGGPLRRLTCLFALVDRIFVVLPNSISWMPTFNTFSVRRPNSLTHANAMTPTSNPLPQRASAPLSPELPLPQQTLPPQGTQDADALHEADVQLALQRSLEEK